jgi:ribosomal protein S27AE
MTDATSCPDCGGVIAHRAGCQTCLRCGYSRCEAMKRLNAAKGAMLDDE